MLENEINRARSIAENLSFHNQSKWNQSDLSQLEISFFEKQQGVIHVFLLDKHGRVLAPIDKVNHVLQYPLVAQALSSGEMEQETMPSGHLLLCDPVKKHGETIGVAVVQYQIRSSVSLLRDRFWQFLFGLLFVLCIAVLFAIILVKMILQPWIGIGNSLELTIGKNRNMLDYTAPYKEVDYLKTQVDRLLLKNERSEQSSSVKNEPESLNPAKASVAKQPPGATKRPLLETSSLGDREIIALVEGKSSQIVDSSPEFQKMFELKGTQDLHILEVFQNPLLLTEIMGLVDNQVSKSEIKIENHMFLLTREEMSQSPGYILIRFQPKG